MAYAIIETGGKQLCVEPGRFYDVERLDVPADESLSIEKVLFVHDGNEATVGQPLVAGATVEATVMQHHRDRKIIVYKMVPKKKTRKKRGHRQELTRLMINSISVNGKALGETSAKAAKGGKAKAKKAEPAAEEAVAVAAEVVDE